MTGEKTYIFLVADLSGYTALTEAHGSQGAAKVIRRFLEIVGISLKPGVRLAETKGDEVLVVGRDATAVVQTAVTLVKRVREETHFPALHAGIHAGKILEQGGRFFGAPLNLAARIGAHAKGCQVLVTREVIERLDPRAGIPYQSIGRTKFRNVREKVSLFNVATGCGKGRPVIIDPVCRMIVDSNRIMPMVVHHGKRYFFCSQQCADQFSGHPEYYIQNNRIRRPK